MTRPKYLTLYSMGTLTHCTDHYGGKGIFGEKPGSHPNAWWQGRIKRLYGYNDNLENDKYCANGDGVNTADNPNDCKTLRGFTTELNEDEGLGKWQESTDWRYLPAMNLYQS